MKELIILNELPSVISKNDETYLLARCKSSNIPLIFRLQVCLKEY